MMKKLAQFVPAAFLLTPMLAFAQYVPGGQTADGILDWLIYWLNQAVPILITVAVVILIYNVIRYVLAADDGKEALKGKILWSIIGLFIILAIWGIIAVISSTLGIGIGGNSLPTPGVPTL